VLPKNYYNLFDIARKEGIKSNTVKSAIGTVGLKGINDLTAIRPIAHLFREFQRNMRSQYGILCSQYDFWKRTGEPPKVSSGRPPKWKDNPEYARLDVPIRQSTKERFQNGIKRANQKSVQQTTQSEQTEFALIEYMDRRPSVFGADAYEKQQ
jgi:hypothetical protein